MTWIQARGRPFALGLLAVAMAVVTSLWLAGRDADAADAPPASNAASAVLLHDGAAVLVPDTSALRRMLVVEPADERVLRSSFALPATVEADPSRLVKVLPPLAGRIASLDKQLGDSVKPGDLLFTLDAADLTQAASDAHKAQAALALARKTLDRQLELGRADIAAQRDIDQAHNDVDQAASEWARANARLAQLGVGSGQTAGRMLAVRSPIAGRVVELNAAPGAFWNDATAPLMTVADLSHVFVTASADEQDLGQVFVGQDVKVTLDAYRDDALAGKVHSVGELLDPDTRRVKVRLQFANRDGRLKPGMFAQASFQARPHRALWVPMAAVVQRGLHSRVFVETGAWRFEARVVSLGPKVGEGVEIVAGLKAGERIVVKDGVLLDD